MSNEQHVVRYTSKYWAVRRTMHGIFHASFMEASIRT